MFFIIETVWHILIFLVSIALPCTVCGKYIDTCIVWYTSIMLECVIINTLSEYDHTYFVFLLHDLADRTGVRDFDGGHFGNVDNYSSLKIYCHRCDKLFLPIVCVCNKSGVLLPHW